MKLFKLILALFIIGLVAVFLYKKLPEVHCYISGCPNNNDKFHYKRVVESTLYDFFTKFKILHKSYTPDNVQEYLKQENIDFDIENNKIIAESLKKLKESKHFQETESKIPLISHKVYLTKIDNPNQINALNLEITKTSYDNLNSYGEWQHFIWTNVPEIIPKEITQIKGVKVRSIEEFIEHPLHISVISSIKKADDITGYLAEASDTFRLMALQKFGGIYTDMDYEIYNSKSLIDLMKKFDFIGVIGINLYYENGFLVSKAGHPVIERAVQLQLRNHGFKKDVFIPDSIKYPSDPYRKIFFSGPPIVTVAYLQENNKLGNNDVILPHWVGFNSMFAHFKNGACETTDKITREEFAKKNQNLGSLIKQFTEEYKQDPNSLYNRFKPLKEYQHNIYFDPEHFDDLEIIGGDMVCGSWSKQFEGFDRFYYWKFPWQKN